jgi:hypothetical protein
MTQREKAFQRQQVHARELARRAGVEYLDRLPRAIPADRVLVHNHVRPTRRLGMRGFRAWLAAPNAARLQVCDCGWAPEFTQHFRVAGMGQ